MRGEKGEGRGGEGRGGEERGGEGRGGKGRGRKPRVGVYVCETELDISVSMAFHPCMSSQRDGLLH